MRDLRKGEGDQADHLADMQAIDRVLVSVLGCTDDIPAMARDFRREALFKRGELLRMVCDALRQANGPLTARELTERVLERKNMALKPGKIGKERINRVRRVCKGLQGLVKGRGVDGCETWCNP